MSMDYHPSLSTQISPPSTPVPAYFSLGATLYTPATRPDLKAVLNGRKVPGLRSLVICTEDAVHDRDLQQALGNLQQCLGTLQPHAMQRFVRPRSPEVLARILDMPGVEALDGLVLPKVNPENLARYAEQAARRPNLWLMPTLETELAFNRRALELLCQHLAELLNPVLCLRVGGNDLLNLLGIRRSPSCTLYDTPLRTVLNDIILTFRPAGFEIAAPVFDVLDNPITLAQEVAMDIHHGLLTKTAIHPTQIPIIEGSYRVNPEEQQLAERILAPQAQAVFRHAGQMCEPVTQRHWAQRLLTRGLLYGIHEGENSP